MPLTLQSTSSQVGIFGNSAHSPTKECVSIEFDETSVREVVAWIRKETGVTVERLTEMLNTAIERAIDRISMDKHELSKEAKDMGSAAVFMALVFCGFAWVMIAIPKFF